MSKVVQTHLPEKLHFSGLRMVSRAIAVMMLVSLQAMAQLKVNGKITVSSGEPLPGASIVEEGTNSGTSSDANGLFSITVTKPTSKLTISYIGYLPQTLLINGKSVVNVVLEEDLKNLSEVVVIGYGTVKKRDLTGTVTSIKSEDIKQVPAQNPLESIQGKVAGVDIQRSSGSASSGVSITIRGNRSIGAGNRPLYIIDGVQASEIDNLNPNDIESIEFLKDASSTAIYGWQGANGIVIVTTKKGISGKPRITFNTYYGVSQVSRYPAVNDGPAYVAMKREANRATGKWNSATDDPLIFNTQELAAIKNNEWIDYQKLLFKNGTQQDYNIGVNAGNDKTKVFFSLDYFKEGGILKFDQVNRYSLRANVDQTINKWLKIGIQSQVTNRDESYRRDPLNMANKIIPLGTVYDKDGNFIVFPLSGSSISPLADEQPNIFSNTGKQTNVIANAYLEMNPLKGLTFRSNFGGNLGYSRTGLLRLPMPSVVMEAQVRLLIIPPTAVSLTGTTS